jgi:hypothetical protein
LSLPTTLLGLALAATLSPASPAPAGTCTPARSGPNVAVQPEAWRSAVEALVASTATPGLPWSCTGGEVDLVAGEAGATLTVVDADGHAVTREVATPEDVQPLGEALLAKPLPAPPEVEKAAPAPRKEPAVTAPRPPRVLLSGLLAPRYAGAAQVLWGGVIVAAALPPGPWGGGVWIRYDGIAVPLAEHMPPLREVCMGATAFRSFAAGPLELRAALRPSLAVVSREGDRDQREETRFDFRLGAEAQALVPITKALRAVVALDGELSPIELAHGMRPSRDREAPFPTYTLGLGLGMEVAIR